MKNSLLTKLAILGIGSLICAGGIFVGLQNKQNKKAAAATTYEYYFIPDSSWSEANASFKIQFADNDGPYSMSLASIPSEAKTHLNITDTNIYHFTSIVNHSNAKFLRYDSTGSQYWDSSNYFNVKADRIFKKTADWWSTWTADQGEWLDADAVYKKEECNTPSSDTGRIFLCNSGSAFGDNNRKNAVRAWGGSASKIDTFTFDASIYELTWFGDNDGNNTWYGYADIPTDVSGFQFVTLDSSGDVSYGDKAKHYSITNFDIEDNTFAKVYYCNGTNIDSISISTGGAKNDKAGSNLLTNVFKAYSTCDSSSYNGYGAAADLNNHFYSHAVSGATDTLIEKYLDVDYTIGQKMAQMAELYNKANPSTPIAGYGAYSALKTDLNDSGNAIATCAVLATLTVGFGLIVLRKKKVA